METEKVDIKNIARDALTNVFRTDTDQPGFIHIDFGQDISSTEFRTLMIQLKTELSVLVANKFHKKLTYQWLGRFDQQLNTPHHLDNAADQSFLMLGYEPSDIESELYLADYHKFSKENKKAANKNFDESNPIYLGDEKLLEPYVTKVQPFPKDTYKIVLINNSNSKAENLMLGVFHKAKIINQDLSKKRVVNSMMLNMVPMNLRDEKKIDEADFKITEHVST